MKSQRYETSDLNLASALMTYGFELIDVDKSNPKRVVFVFDREDDKDNIDGVVDDYFKDRLVMSARKLFGTMKTLKTRLYN